MGSIFISYRRADAAGHAQNLFDRLSAWFDAESELFFDGASIDSGQHFPQRLVSGVDAASVVLVLIGPGWVEEVRRRAADAAQVDFVRVEVERALARRARGESVLVVPVLMTDVKMPSADELGERLASLAPLCAIHGHEFGGGKQATRDFQFSLLRDLIARHPHAPRERLRDRSGAALPWSVVDHSVSPHFQDPNGLLLALRAQLEGGSPAAVVGAVEGKGGAKTAALHGMGGIGKTQLALAYSHAYRDHYAGVWWLRAESASGQGDALLQQDALAACAAVGVSVPEGASPSQVLKQWLGGQKAPWLLVFDNADDADALRKHLPVPGVHHVVITSRRPDWGGVARTLKLETWTPQQGADFLVRRLGERAVRTDAETLALELGGLPLALDQAASYVAKRGVTVAKYLQLWRSAAALQRGCSTKTRRPRATS